MLHSEAGASSLTFLAALFLLTVAYTCSWDDSSLEGAGLERAGLEGAGLEGAGLERASLEGAGLAVCATPVPLTARLGLVC